MIGIENFIPAGYHNRVTRGYLHEILHMSDRLIREEIEDAQNRGILIVSRDGGYFQRRDDRDDPYILSYIRQENRRFKTMSHKNKMLNQAWERIHPDCRQIKGQMRMGV